MEKEAEEKAVMELKLEVQRVKILIDESLKVEDEDDNGDEDDELEEWLVDGAIGTVRALKELKEIRSDGGLKILRNLGFQPPPKEFICPISRLLMEDPVVGGVTGLSYERRSIEKWVLDGNRKWPDSDQELGAVSLISNNLLKKFILQWCENPFFREEFEEEDDDDGVERFYGLIIPNTEEPPQLFLCPVCRNLMVNPVLAASGQTFDEQCIAKWLEEGNTKCPKTDQLLPHTLLIPNLSIKAIIHKWRTRLTPQGDDEGDDDEPPFRAANQDHLIDTIVQLPDLTTTSEQLPLLKDLRLLTARLPSFRGLFARLNGATSMLLHPFLITTYKSDASLYNEAVAIVMNISVEESNKRKIVQDCPSLITFLVEALELPDSIDTRCYAAAALGQLSYDDSNSLSIGASSDVFRLLTRLLEVGHPIASREAASAVWSLCWMPENRERFFLSEGLPSFVEKLKDPELADVILELLASISSHSMTVNAVMDQDMLPLLFRMMEETKSKRDEENCVVVIFPVGLRKIGEVEKVKDGARILYRVSDEGSERARRKATTLLSKMKGKAPMPW